MVNFTYASIILLFYGFLKVTLSVPPRTVKVISLPDTMQSDMYSSLKKLELG